MKTTLILTLLLGLSLLALAQGKPTKPQTTVNPDDITFEIEKKDALQIRRISDYIVRKNTDMKFEAVAAFDAMSSQLSKVQVESKDLDRNIVFSFGKAISGMFSAFYENSKSLPLVGVGIEFLQDIYNINKTNKERNERIADAQAFNSIKDILTTVARKRNSQYITDREVIENNLTKHFEKEGPAYLDKLEASLPKSYEFLNQKIGDGTRQELLFEFAILQEIYRGLNASLKNKKPFVCAVAMGRCDKDTWATSLTQKNQFCKIIRARYDIEGTSYASVLKEATNNLLKQLAQEPDVKSRTVLPDLDMDFYFRIRPPDCNDQCYIMVPVSRKNRKVTITGNPTWHDCATAENVFLFQLSDTKNSLKPLLEPVIQRVAKQNLAFFGETFLDQEVPVYHH